MTPAASITLAFFILAVAGGIIAYIGDRLGTHIGKKRISKLGLRPRHTAMLYTVLSGIAIAWLTLGFLIAINHNFRRALLRGSEIIADNRALIIHNRQLQLQIYRSERSLASLGQNLNAAQAKQAAAERRAKSAERDQRLAQEKLVQTRDALGRSQASLQKQEGELRRAQGALTAAHADLSAAQTNLRSETQHLAQTHGDLTQAQRAVKEKIAEIVKAKSEYVAALNKVVDLEHKGDVLKLHNTDLTAKNTRLVNENVQLTTQRLVYRKGQELGRSVISSNQPLGAIRNELVAYLEQISRDAVEREGKVGDNGRAVVVAPPGGDEKTGLEPASLTEDLKIDALAHSIAGQQGVVRSVVVVAQAKYNTFIGEQTQIDVHLYDNVLVFAKGSLIANGQIDGTQPEDVILASLQAFLTQNVRPIALRHGVIPTRDVQTGDVSVGQPTDSSLTLALVKQIQQIGAGARVNAYAGEDTYSSGPLRLRLTAVSPTDSVLPVTNS